MKRKKKIFMRDLCELSPEINIVLYIRLVWDIIHSGHTFCAKRIHIMGSETFEGIVLSKHLRK